MKQHPLVENLQLAKGELVVCELQLSSTRCFTSNKSISDNSLHDSVCADKPQADSLG